MDWATVAQIALAVFIGSAAKDALLAVYVNYRSNRFRKQEMVKLEAAREEIMARLGAMADAETNATD